MIEGQVVISLVRDGEGHPVMGFMLDSHFFPLVTFGSLDELRAFGENVLAFHEYCSPKVPAAFLGAFKEEEKL